MEYSKNVLTMDFVENSMDEISVMTGIQVINEIEKTDVRLVQLIESLIIKAGEKKKVLSYSISCLIENDIAWPVKVMKNGSVKPMGFSTVKKAIKEGTINKVDYFSGYSKIESISNALNYHKGVKTEKEEKPVHTDMEKVLYLLDRMEKDGKNEELAQVAFVIAEKMA